MLAIVAANNVYGYRTNVYVSGLPAYAWTKGCYGTAAGIVLGYWDRNGLDDVYTGPTSGGVAPISAGADTSITALWASKAGLDGRATNDYGHVDDYWVEYDSTADDPYITEGREEHTPDCIGDFMGLNQRKWTNLNNECNGNIDGWAFTFYATNGARQIDYVPADTNGVSIPDVPSGLRAYMQYCGYDAQVFSQLADVWMDTPTNTGFTFEDLVREIDTGYPVILNLQEKKYKGSNGYNPDLHAVTAAGYLIEDDGTRKVRVRWGWYSDTGKWNYCSWSTNRFSASYSWSYLRGAIGIHPMSKTMAVTGSVPDALTMKWDGPANLLYDAVNGMNMTVHWYVVEAASSVTAVEYAVISPPTSERSITITNLPAGAGCLRIRHLERVKVEDAALRTNLYATIGNDKVAPSNMFFDLDFEGMTDFNAVSNGIVRLESLEWAKELTNLDLSYNSITQLDALVLNSDWGGLGTGDVVNVSSNLLNNYAVSNQIPVLTNRGVVVIY